MTPRSQEVSFEKEYAKELISIAEGDLESAIILGKNLKSGRIENIFYLAQQAIEKALKAVLCWRGKSFPLVHDAGILLAKLPNDVSPPYGYELSALTQFATVRRYEEGAVKLTQEEMQQTIKIASDILEWANAELLK